MEHTVRVNIKGHGEYSTEGTMLDTFLAAYRDAEKYASERDAAWPGTRYVRAMFGAVAFPISFAMACQLADEYRSQSVALYWGENTRDMARIHHTQEEN